MATIAQLIDIRPNRAGEPRAYIAGTRVRVLDVYAMAELQGCTPDEIIQSLPQLTLAQVHAALAHCFSNRDETVRQLRDEEDLVRHFRGMTGPGPLEAKHASGAAGSDSLSP
ncbi:MAG TPA: DUF433 domain-containing protein [Pirellulales bacterium]|jgi:uncharacterized protein (DUF433 family)|nr:DUF433 domain-containing protein [Pirellulales bacterium]